MSNILAVRKLAATITVNHYFSNVSEQPGTAAETFEEFMNRMNIAFDNGCGGRPAFMAFDEEDSQDPVIWDSFAEDWLETLAENIDNTFNDVLLTAVEVGLVSDGEIRPFLR